MPFSLQQKPRREAADFLVGTESSESLSDAQTGDAARLAAAMSEAADGQRADLLPALLADPCAKAAFARLGGMAGSRLVHLAIQTRDPELLPALLAAGCPGRHALLAALQQLASCDPLDAQRLASCRVVADLALDAACANLVPESSDTSASPLAALIALWPTDAEFGRKALALCDPFVGSASCDGLRSICMTLRFSPLPLSTAFSTPSLEARDLLLGQALDRMQALDPARLKRLAADFAQETLDECLASHERIAQMHLALREEEMSLPESQRDPRLFQEPELSSGSAWLAIDRLAARGLLDAPLLLSLRDAAFLEGEELPFATAFVQSIEIADAAGLGKRLGERRVGSPGDPLAGGREGPAPADAAAPGPRAPRL
jgi:hypothetical protein